MNERQKKTVIIEVAQKVKNDNFELDKYAAKYFFGSASTLKCKFGYELCRIKIYVARVSNEIQHIVTYRLCSA